MTARRADLIQPAHKVPGYVLPHHAHGNHEHVGGPGTKEGHVHLGLGFALRRTTPIRQYVAFEGEYGFVISEIISPPVAYSPDHTWELETTAGTRTALSYHTSLADAQVAAERVLVDAGVER